MTLSGRYVTAHGNAMFLMDIRAVLEHCLYHGYRFPRHMVAHVCEVGDHQHTHLVAAGAIDGWMDGISSNHFLQINILLYAYAVADGVVKR